MNMHFLTVIELKGCATIVLYGEPNVGKTTFAAAAMSILGIEMCKFRGIRREYLVHLASQTSVYFMMIRIRFLRLRMQSLISTMPSPGGHSTEVLKLQDVAFCLDVISHWENFKGKMNTAYPM